jgi:hypothetical protein
MLQVMTPIVAAFAAVGICVSVGCGSTKDVRKPQQNDFGRVEKGRLTQKTASIAMVGAVAADAQIAVMIREMGDAISRPPVDDLTLRYLDLAGFHPKTSSAVTNAFSDQKVQSRVQRQALVDLVEADALRLDPSGPAWFRLGQGFELFVVMLPVMGVSDASIPDDTNKHVSLIHFMDAPTIKLMEQAGTLVEMPLNLRRLFNEIVNADLSTYRGSVKCLLAAKRFRKILQTVAIQGDSALLAFPE